MYHSSCNSTHAPKINFATLSTSLTKTRCRKSLTSLEHHQDFGEYHFRSIHETEIHMNTPDVIYKMQEFAGLLKRVSQRIGGLSTFKGLITTLWVTGKGVIWVCKGSGYSFFKLGFFLFSFLPPSSSFTCWCHWWFVRVWAALS